MFSHYKSNLSEILNDGEKMHSSTIDTILSGMTENCRMQSGSNSALIFPRSCFLQTLLRKFEEAANDHDRFECIKNALQFHKVFWSEEMVQSHQRIVFVALLEPQKRWVTIGIDQTKPVHVILGMDTEEEEWQVSNWPALMRLVCFIHRLFWGEIPEPLYSTSVPIVPLLRSMCGLLAVENARNFVIGAQPSCFQISEIRMDIAALYVLGECLESCRIRDFLGRKRKQGHEEGASSNTTGSREKKEKIFDVQTIDLSTEVEAEVPERQCVVCSSIEGAFFVAISAFLT